MLRQATLTYNTITYNTYDMLQCIIQWQDITYNMQPMQYIMMHSRMMQLAIISYVIVQHTIRWHAINRSSISVMSRLLQAHQLHGIKVANSAPLSCLHHSSTYSIAFRIYRQRNHAFFRRISCMEASHSTFRRAAPASCQRVNFPTKTIPTKIAWHKLSGKILTGLGIQPLIIKITFESNPLKSIMLVRRLAVSSRTGYLTVRGEIIGCVKDGLLSPPKVSWQLQIS